MIQLLCAALPPKSFDRLIPPLPSPGALRIPLFLAIMNGRTTTIASPANTKRTMSPCSMNALMSLAAYLTKDALSIDYSMLMPLTVLMLVSGRCTETGCHKPPAPPLFPHKPFAQNTMLMHLNWQCQGSTYCCSCKTGWIDACCSWLWAMYLISSLVQVHDVLLHEQQTY